jgi:multicomponent Na+:H+ antiporter subunit G
MKDIISISLIALGTFLIFVASIGLLRMPDLFTRMSATTKAATLGVGMILLGTAVHFIEDQGLVSRMIATILFIMLTTPVSAHMLGRAAYSDGVPLYEGTQLDELQGRYDHLKKRGQKAGPPQAPQQEPQPEGYWEVG